MAPPKGWRHSPETRERMSRTRRGAANANWKGGRIKTHHDYVLAYAGPGKHVYEHRLVMEEHLGRPLTDEEVVHHINGDRSDNRIENLQLFANNGEHKSHEYRLREAG